MSKRRTNPDFLNGVPELVVLSLLSRQPMHGYQLVQAIKDSSDNEVSFGEGCIYPLLHKLEARGDLTSKRVSVAGRSRVIYRTTQAGGRRLAQTADEWRKITRAVSQLLQGDEYEPAGVTG